MTAARGRLRRLPALEDAPPRSSLLYYETEWRWKSRVREASQTSTSRAPVNLAASGILVRISTVVSKRLTSNPSCT